MKPPRHSLSIGKRMGRYARWFIVGLMVYALSTGPVMATGFWLREQTGSDTFYAVMLPYYPLLISKRLSAPGTYLHQYIERWVEAFGTVGPG